MRDLECVDPHKVSHKDNVLKFSTVSRDDEEALCEGITHENLPVLLLVTMELSDKWNDVDAVDGGVRSLVRERKRFSTTANNATFK